ncbi:hypothetical protein KSP40_PGU022200 [Platanthera guangdongensis]|uniref:Uncharacterized protein n=1 Tax=Platanthera guangdongensis TaxID=2320717 RepID=A0ABR2MKU6_9ASPA
MEDADEKMAAAEALIRLSHSSPYWPPAKTYDLWPVNWPETATSLKAIPSLRLPRWGRRSRRSRCSCIREKAKMEEDSSGPASKTRRSPATPLDFGSTLAPSTSGSDEAPSTSSIHKNKCRRRRGGDPSSPFRDVYQKGCGGWEPSKRRCGSGLEVDGCSPETEQFPRSVKCRREQPLPPYALGRLFFQCGGGCSVLTSTSAPNGPSVQAQIFVGTAELSHAGGVAISSSKPVRRREKKKTVTELQAQVRSLEEEHEMLRQSVERKKKEMEDLIAENHRLRGEEGSCWQSKAVKARFIFPDLNEAATET